MTNLEKRELDFKSMNELRAILYEASIEYPDDATRPDLIKLILNNL